MPGSEREVNSDQYYGATARQYERMRQKTELWLAEQAVITEWVTQGPVLDVPVGTGRFIPHYLSRGIDFIGVDISPDMLSQAAEKDPYAPLDRGDILAGLPFADRAFRTVVCVRLLVWLPPDDMARALAECLRLGDEVVFSVRVGVEGRHPRRASLTHSEQRVLDALGDRPVLERRTLKTSHAGEQQMWRVGQ